MGKVYLGIELGSTRIKAVVIDETGFVLAAAYAACAGGLPSSRA